MSSRYFSRKAKINYVKSQPQDRDHACHWPGCTQQVAPAKWGCLEHWGKLPYSIREAIWDAYRPGQENDMHPSEEYLCAAKAAQAWIRKHLESKAK